LYEQRNTDRLLKIARLILQNRRVQVRFLSHLPLDDLWVSTIWSVALYQA